MHMATIPHCSLLIVAMNQKGCPSRPNTDAHLRCLACSAWESQMATTPNSAIASCSITLLPLNVH